MGGSLGIAVGDRPHKHTQRLLQGYVYGSKVAIREAGAVVGGRQPFPKRSRHSVRMYSKGRRQDRQYSRRIRTGQDIPRRLHDRFIEKISAIRMGTQQRISHSRTSAGNRRARPHSAPPTLLWSLRPHYPRNNRLTRARNNEPTLIIITLPLTAITKAKRQT